MKKITLSLATIIATSTFVLAGGDIAPVEPVVETPVVMETPSVGGLYLGLGYSVLTSDLSDLTLNNNSNLGADYKALMFQAGYKFNAYVAVEGRYWKGLSSEALKLDNISFNKRFDSDADAWGIYVKPMYPVSNAFDIYGLLGYGKATAKGIVNNNSGGSIDLDVSGISWGVGADYSFTDNVAVFVDYVAFTSDTITDNALTGIVGRGGYDHDFDSINFGVTYSF